MSVISWLGNAEYGVAGTRLKEGNPVVFRPTDISGLQLWLDANDGSTTTDNNFGTLLSWHNKGDLSGNFDLSGTADVRLGDNFVNGLNVVTFNANAFMTGTFAFNFQDRSLFIVSKRNTMIDNSGGIGVFTWLTGDTTGQIESGILYDLSANNFNYLISKHPGFAVELDFQTATDTTGYAELATFVNSSTDLSANYVSLNGNPQTAIVSNLASGYATSSLTYFLGNYFGGTSLANDYDLCELIMYDTALTGIQIGLVEEYLKSKWAITNPPTPSFSPQDIGGLQIWFDSTQFVTTDLSGNVDSWKNLGSAGGFALPDVGYAIPTIDLSMNNLQVVAFNQSQLKWSGALNYLDRTQFVVSRPTSDMTGATYPYLTFVAGGYSCMQTGLNWDSNTSNHTFAMCQNGLNCPVLGDIASNPFGQPLLAVFVNDGTNLSNNAMYYNNGSNINYGSNLGNLFDGTTQVYQLNNAYNQVDGQNQNLGEILEYDSVLSLSNIAKVTTYLSDKWGLGL